MQEHALALGGGVEAQSKGITEHIRILKSQEECIIIHKDLMEITHIFRGNEVQDFREEQTDQLLALQKRERKKIAWS
jgi:hypothetical protein